MRQQQGHMWLHGDNYVKGNPLHSYNPSHEYGGFVTQGSVSRQCTATKWDSGRFLRPKLWIRTSVQNSVPCSLLYKCTNEFTTEHIFAMFASSCDLQWRKTLVFGLSTCWPGFFPDMIYVKFVVDKNDTETGFYTIKFLGRRQTRVATAMKEKNT